MMNGMQSIGRRVPASNYVSTKQDIEKVLKKSPEDIAESLEIMICESRHIGITRTALRGACCLIRKEPTTVTPEIAINSVNDLKAQWIKAQIQARVVICERAVSLIQGRN